ncbi:MAG: helix-turn-helix domain-containing protein [Vicinamibacterales bacterium]
MEPVGTRLRQAREARKLSLRDVAARTKIATNALDALERNDYARLPGGIYARSFVRSYAELVELDPDSTVEAFGEELARHEREAASRKAKPKVTAGDREFLARQERAMHLLRVGVVVGAVVVVALVGWLAWWYFGRDHGDPEPAPAAPPAEVRQPVTPPPPADPLPAEVPPPAEARERLTVAFEVTADCWVNVTADGLVVFERVLSPGEPQSFSADHELVLDVGNAGAFTWTINGRKAKALGRDGQHRMAHVTRENLDTYLQ